MKQVTKDNLQNIQAAHTTQYQENKQPNQNVGKELHRHFSKEAILIANKDMKNAQHSSLFSSVQFSSVAQSCPTLCNPMNHSTPGLPVHYHLPEFTQTHVH